MNEFFEQALNAKIAIKERIKFKERKVDKFGTPIEYEAAQFWRMRLVEVDTLMMAQRYAAVVDKMQELWLLTV